MGAQVQKFLPMSESVLTIFSEALEELYQMGHVQSDVILRAARW